MKETDLQGVRSATIVLARAVDLTPVKDMEFLVQHPFTNTSIVPDFGEKHNFLNLIDPESQERWMKGLENYINRCDINKIFCELNTPWCLTWLDFVKGYLSDKDFSEYLAYSWMTEENPNMDVNVEIPKIIKWFRKADKQYLMSKEDLEYYEALPETITVYRGVSVGRVDLGLSWTDDREKAEWFMHRFDRKNNNEKGHLLSVTCPKQYALAYLDSRNEKEIVLDVLSVKHSIKTILE